MQLGIRVRYNNVLAENRLRQKINAHNECAQGQTGDGQATLRSRLAGRMPGLKCSRQELRQENSQALIPLVGNNSRFINYSNAKAYTYTNLMAVGFHLPLSWFSFLSIHIPILFIYNNPDGLF